MIAVISHIGRAFAWWRWVLALAYAGAGAWWLWRGVPAEAWAVKGLIGVWLAYAPVRLTRRWRPLGWCLVLGANVIGLGWIGAWAWAAISTLVHLTAFEPGLAPPRQADTGKTPEADVRVEPELLFYDGYCGLCQASVRLVAAIDREPARFHFAPLQGRTLRERMSPAQRQALPDSVVVQTASGDVLVKSQAVGYVLERLGGGWRVLGWLVRAVPRPLADWAYDAVARVRSRLFQPPPDACPIVPPNLRSRFVEM